MLCGSNRVVVVGSLLVALAAWSEQAGAAEARIWTDKSGKFEIRAKFIDIIDGKVRLERPNGDISRVPLGKLSDKDQEFVEQQANKPETLAEEQPAQPQQPQPQQPRGLAVGDRIEAKSFGEWKPGVVAEIDYKWNHVDVKFDDGSIHGHSKSVDDLRLPGTLQHPVLIKPVNPVLEVLSGLKVVQPDLSDVQLLLSGESSATTVAPDPRAASAETWKPRAVRLQGRTDFHERPLDFAITGGPEPLAMVLHAPPGFDEDDLPRVELVDMKARKVLASGPGLPHTEQVVLSPTGKRAATIASGRTSSESNGQIDFWEIEGKAVNHTLGFSPYVMNTWPDVDPKWVAWLDDQHLFTTNRKGRTILWQVERAKAVYELMTESGAVPTLSPGRKQLAVPTADGVQIYEARSGDSLATVGTGNLRNATLAFSPSGRQLAAVSSGFVDVIDVTTGEMTRSFPCKDVHGNKGVWWLDEDYLFAANGLLINVPRRITAWKFEAGNSLFKAYAGTQWLLADNRNNNTQALMPFDLPPPEAIAAIDELVESEMLAVRPGATVSVNVKINNGLLADAVEKALVEALEQAGMKVATEAELTLEATMESGETEEMVYQRFGDFRSKGETMNVTNRVYKLQMLLSGTPIWNRESVHSPPHHLRLEKGETIRAAVDRVMQPKAGNFRGRLPAYVVRPKFQEPLGTTKISPGG